MKIENKTRIKNWIVLGFFLSIIGCSKPDSSNETTAAANDQAEANQSDDVTDFIIGGKSVHASDPIEESIVGLLDVRQGALCTASIIAEDILITAAHCAEGNATDLRIKFGLVVTEKNLRTVDWIKVSPLWQNNKNAQQNTGDVALIKFSGGLPAGFHPAQLLPASRPLKNKETAVLAGYGLSDGKSSAGAGRLRVVEIPISNVRYSKSEVLLDQTDGKGACHGDSGGPAFIKINNELQLWGVTSRGSGTGGNDCSGYSIYTRIVPYGQWINSALASMRSH